MAGQKASEKQKSAGNQIGLSSRSRESQERYSAKASAAIRTSHLDLAPGRDGPELVLHHPERESLRACLLDLPSMGIGVEAVISHRDLALVRDMGSDPGDKLQVVHPLHFLGPLDLTRSRVGLGCLIALRSRIARAEDMSRMPGKHRHIGWTP